MARWLDLWRAHGYGRRLRRVDKAAGRPLVVLTRDHSAQLFYVFDPQLVAMRLGARYRQAMDPTTVLRETGLINSNLVLLRDPFHFAFHAGVSAALPDFHSLLRMMQAGAAQLAQVRQRYTLGTSAGGFGALLFGHHLAVDEVLAFAPQTQLDLPILRALSRRKDVWRIPPEHRDLSLLLAAHNGRTRYKLYYCEGNAWDRRQAEHLAGCPGVELHPQPGDSHLVYQAMHESGRLRAVMPAPLTVAPG